MTQTFRIRLVDYKRMRSIFPEMRGETTASYFQRLTMWLHTFKGIGEITK